VNERNLHLVSDASNPTMITYISSSSSSVYPLLVITTGFLNVNNVIFSLNSSNIDAFILLSGIGTVIIQEVTVKVLILFICFFVYGVFMTIN
jgi:hypothetical protein